MISIRKSTVRDESAIVGIILKIEGDSDARGFVSPMATTRQNAELLFATMFHPAILAGDPILLAIENGSIIGASFTLLRRGPVEQKVPSAFGLGWWVEPDHRGEGILTSLLAETEKILRGLKVEAWEEFIHEGNNVALKIAGNRGFHETMVVLRKDLQ